LRRWSSSSIILRKWVTRSPCDPHSISPRDGRGALGASVRRASGFVQTAFWEITPVKSRPRHLAYDELSKADDKPGTPAHDLGTSAVEISLPDHLATLSPQFSAESSKSVNEGEQVVQ
jgi:hypothetical protein